MTNAKEKRVVDVAGPTDAKIDIGSKPMIVGHKSMLSDPMVREEQPAAKTELPSSSRKVVAPDVEPAKKYDPEPAEEKSDKKSDQETEKLANSTEDEPAKDTKDDKKTAEIDSAAAIERDENLRKLIEGKKYNVSIKQAHGSAKGIIFVLLGLLIVVFLALFFMVDTGKFNPGFELPFSVFNN